MNKLLFGKLGNMQIIKTRAGNRVLQYFATKLAKSSFEDFADEVFGGRFVNRNAEEVARKAYAGENCWGEPTIYYRTNSQYEDNFQARISTMTPEEILMETPTSYLRSLWIGQKFLTKERHQIVLREVRRRSKYAQAFLDHQHMDSAVVAEEAVKRAGFEPHVLTCDDEVYGEKWWRCLTSTGETLQITVVFDENDLALNMPIDAQVKIVSRQK